MTVSPQWPQDGNGPQRPSASGGDQEDRLRSPALPPTLFKLPDLDAAAEKVSQTNLTPPAREEVDPSGAFEPAGEAPSPVQQPPVEPFPEPESPPQDPAAETETVGGGSSDEAPSAPRRESNADRPAGRSWMETIGSHGVVVVLLLVVVAAALISGRGNDLEEESNLAEYGDMLDFDSGTEVDLPLPTFHGVEASTQLALNADNPLDGSEGNSQPEGYVPIESVQTPDDSDKGHVSLKALAESASVDYSTRPSSSVGVVPDAPGSPAAAGGPAISGGPSGSDGSIATLSQPQSTSVDVDGSSPVAGSATEANGVRVNEFVGGSSGLDVLAASNRTESQNARTTLPSLEELATQPSKHQASPNVGTKQPIRSKTPLGLDLLNYIPDDTFSVPTNKDIPATSN